MFANLKMPLSDALATSLIGITTVICILAVIALLIILVSKVIRAVEGVASKKAPTASATVAPAVSAPAGVPMPAGMNQGELELINTDEKTAAVIMAIVSDKSGIPLNRLSFKSIKLVEDEK
jgi:Na+-transporting methylmalonyl-CoA/oxaloacetate decarboxylase gamma subunit